LEKCSMFRAARFLRSLARAGNYSGLSRSTFLISRTHFDQVTGTEILNASGTECFSAPSKYW
jgi:hypothetical protein